MLKLFANRQLVRKDAETYEKVSTNSLVFGALLLIGTYICMMLPIVQTNEFSVGSTFMSFITLYAIIGLPVVSAIVFISKFKQWRSKLLLVAGIVSAAMLIPLVVLGVLALVLEGWLIGLLPNIVLTLLVIVLATFCGIVALVKAGDCMSSFMKFFGASCIVVAVLFAVRLFADSMTFLGQDLEYLTYCFDQSIIGQLLAREDALNAVLVGADPLVSQMALHGSSNDLMMIYGAILFLLAATVIFVCNRYKNRVAMAVSATLNAVALVMIFSATSSLGSWDLGSGRTFSYTVAALMLLFAASILYLNVFQYIKGYGKYGFTFVLPFFLTFAIFQLYPIYFTFRTSLTNAEGWAMVLNNEVIGFDNFKKLFTFFYSITRTEITIFFQSN